MKITTNRDDILKPLLQVGSVVERRQTLPILANVLIQATPDQLAITATDLEVELKTKAPVHAEGEAEFTLPARKLIDICKALPDGSEISIDVEGDKAVLRSGRGRYTLGTLPAQDYPAIEPSAAGDRLEIPEKVLKHLIENTAFAMAQQDVRYYLNGMLLEIRGNTIRSVATDGHRLALADAEIDSDADLNLQIILPRKAVLEIGRLLSDSDDTAVLEISGSHIRLHLNETTFTSKLIDGRFPDYERVMPGMDTQEVIADREMLRQALARTAILSNEKYRGIRFRLSPGLLHLQAHNPEQDEAEEEVEIDYDGPEMTIGFNVGYLLDVLGVIHSDKVRMAVSDSNTSSLVTALDNEDARYVIMPMRL